LLDNFSKKRLAIVGCFILIFFVLSLAIVSVLRANFYSQDGITTTTKSQISLNRLEVLKGGIARVKKLIRQGGDHKAHLAELLIEQEGLQMKVSNSTSDFRLKLIKENEDTREIPDSINDKNVIIDHQVQFDRINESVALKEFYYQLTQGVFLKVLALSVDRWVGLEGVMAVVSYPNKGRALIIDTFIEKRTPGEVTRYQEIANSKYQWVDSNVWQFASLPGAVAFLYFSGSFWIILFGMILFAFLVQFLEFLIYKGTRNPILCSLLGVSLANYVAQFGIAPAQGSVYLLMIFVGVLTIAIVQNLKLITNKLFS